MAVSGPLVAVTNRTAGSWWLLLAHSWSLQIILSGLGGFFWPTLGRKKSHYRVVLSGPLLVVANRAAGAWDFFWPSLGRNKSYCRVLLAFSGPFLLVTQPGLGGFFWPSLGCNKSTIGSWWFFLAHSWA